MHQPPALPIRKPRDSSNSFRIDTPINFSDFCPLFGESTRFLKKSTFSPFLQSPESPLPWDGTQCPPLRPSSYRKGGDVSPVKWGYNVFEKADAGGHSRRKPTTSGPDGIHRQQKERCIGGRALLWGGSFRLGPRLSKLRALHHSIFATHTKNCE